MSIPKSGFQNQGELTFTDQYVAMDKARSQLWMLQIPSGPSIQAAWVYENLMILYGANLQCFHLTAAGEMEEI